MIYYLMIGLQVFCLIHAIRSGSTRMWIYILIFLPLVGALAYFIMEVIPQFGKQEQIIESTVQLFDPGIKIRSLEANLKISDTLTNREVLADAYLEAQMYEKAIEQYEACLQGIFAEDAGILQKAAYAYFYYGDLEAVIEKSEKVKEIQGRFLKEADQLIYARALMESGLEAAAAATFEDAIVRYHSVEAQYHLGELQRAMGQRAAAKDSFTKVLEEYEQLPSHMGRKVRKWVDLARQSLSEL